MLGALCILGCASLADASPFAYVANQDGHSVSVLDLATNSKIKDITLPATEKPYGVAVNRFGSRVYVSNSAGNNITVIDTMNDSVTTFPTTYKPRGLAVDPAGTRLYVSNFENGSLSVFDALTGAELGSVATGNNPEGVAVNADGSRVYVANSGSNTVSVFDNTLTEVTGSPITVGSTPIGIAVRGTRAYVANSFGGSVSVIDTANNTVVATVAVGSMPFGVATTLDVPKVYVSNQGEDRIAVIDTNNNSVEADKIALFSSPRGIAITPDGSKVIAAIHLEDNASIIDPGTKAQLATPSTGLKPSSLGNFAGPELFPITISAGSDGKITPQTPISTNPSTGVLLAPKGQDLVLNITPDPNFAVKTLTVNSTPLAPPFPQTNTFPTVSGPNSIAATFERTHYSLNVTKQANGNAGSYSRVYVSTPASPVLDCGAGCTSASASYRMGDTVTLRAEYDASKVYFIEWQGLMYSIASGCGTTGPTCSFVMNGNDADAGTYDVKAVFVEIPQAPVNSLQAAYNLAASGSTITCAASYANEPAGSFNANRSVNVTLQTAASGTTFLSTTTPRTFTVSSGSITISGSGAFTIL